MEKLNLLRTSINEFDQSVHVTAGPAIGGNCEPRSIGCMRRHLCRRAASASRSYARRANLQARPQDHQLDGGRSASDTPAVAQMRADRECRFILDIVLNFQVNVFLLQKTNLFIARPPSLIMLAACYVLCYTGGPMHSVAASERPCRRYFSAPAVERSWRSGHAALQHAGDRGGCRDERGHGHSAGKYPSID